MNIDFTRAVLTAKTRRDAILRIVGTDRRAPGTVATPELKTAWESYDMAQRQVGAYVLKECGIHNPADIWNGEVSA